MFLDRIRRLADRPYPGRIELAALAVLYGAYELVRGFGSEDWVAARAHTADIVALERRLNLFVEQDVQDLAGAASRRARAARLPLRRAPFRGHGRCAHLGAPPAPARVSVPAHDADRQHGARARRLRPVSRRAAAPRDLGFADTVSTHTGLNLSSDLLGSLYNPIAAVPSLHFGYSLIVGVAVAQLASRRSLRLVGAAYPGADAPDHRRDRQPLPLRRRRRRPRRRRRLVRRLAAAPRPAPRCTAPVRLARTQRHLDAAFRPDPRPGSLSSTHPKARKDPTHVTAEAQQQPRSPHGPLECEPLEDRGLRLARVRGRVRLHRRRGRHEVPRGQRPRRRRGRPRRPRSSRPASRSPPTSRARSS